MSFENLGQHPIAGQQSDVDYQIHGFTVWGWSVNCQPIVICWCW